MCKRTEPDPLLRLFVDEYNLHLLAIPRENAAVGDVYVHDGRRTSAPGSITHLLTPPFTMPAHTRGERLADVAGTLSRGVDVAVSIGLLEGFLTALGVGAAIGDTKAELSRAGARALRFRFGDATRDSVDPLRLGNALTGHVVKRDNAFHDDRNRYYLVTAVVRSPSIAVTAQSEKSTAASLNVEAFKLLDVGGSVSVKKSSEGEVTFTGPRPLAFGVELYELVTSPEGALRLRAPDSAVKVRGRLRAPVPEPAFIGGDDGDAFLTIA